MLVARLVVQGRPRGDQMGEALRVEGFAPRSQCIDLFDEAEQVAPIPVTHGDHGGACSLGQRQWPSDEALRPVHELCESGAVEAVEHHDVAARQERADEDDRAVLDIGQERILLGAVEAVDFVDEEQRALTDLPALGGSSKDPAQVRHPREGGGDLFEDEAGLADEQSGDRRLAASGRPHKMIDEIRPA